MGACIGIITMILTGFLSGCGLELLSVRVAPTNPNKGAVWLAMDLLFPFSRIVAFQHITFRWIYMVRP